MVKKNIGFGEVILFVSNEAKTAFLKELKAWEEKTGLKKEDAYFNIFDQSISYGVDPLFESPEQVAEYMKTGKIN